MFYNVRVIQHRTVLIISLLTSIWTIIKAHAVYWIEGEGSGIGSNSLCENPYFPSRNSTITFSGCAARHFIPYVSAEVAHLYVFTQQAYY